MSYQKCPICLGLGKVKTDYEGYQICSVCNGTKIISQLNGLPPNVKYKSMESKNLISDWLENNSDPKITKEVGEEWSQYEIKYEKVLKERESNKVRDAIYDAVGLEEKYRDTLKSTVLPRRDRGVEVDWSTTENKKILGAWEQLTTRSSQNDEA